MIVLASVLWIVCAIISVYGWYRSRQFHKRGMAEHDKAIEYYNRATDLYLKGLKGYR